MAIKSNKFLIAVTYCLLSVCFVACVQKKKEVTTRSKKFNNLRAEGYVVVPQTFSNTYTASGSLLPNEQIDIHPEVSGRVTNIFFKEGSMVKKGQMLVQIYDGEIKANIRKLQAQKQLQQKMQERQRQLLNIGGISRQEYESTQTQVRSFEADIASAQAQLRATKIIAPFNGTIGIRNISVGAIVSPTTLITTLQQVHPLKMDFTIPDQYRRSVKNGKEVFFSVTGLNDTLSGKIVAIDPGADPATRTVKVRAVIPNPSGRLVAGSFAQVIIPLQSDNNAILIPSQAVIPTTKDKKVAVVKEGKAKLVVVHLGERTNDKVEVLDGLQSGDTIVLTGLMQVKPGMKVKITKVNS
jgi:membrane fusion protein (multidrug efflux system)